jgi:hypothetical protein
MQHLSQNAVVTREDIRANADDGLLLNLEFEWNDFDSPI